jgi:hypothetical protein
LSVLIDNLLASYYQLNSINSPNPKTESLTKEGFYYTGKIKIGTKPEQEFNVRFDTGS